MVGGSVQVEGPSELGVLGFELEGVDEFLYRFSALFSEYDNVGVAGGDELLVIIFIEPGLKDGDESARVVPVNVHLLKYDGHQFLIIDSLAHPSLSNNNNNNSYNTTILQYYNITILQSYNPTILELI